jgi:hypothetical protein
MPLKVKIKEKVADGVWSATGNISINNGEKEGPAEVLFQETGSNKVKLILNSKHGVSKIFDREVILYTNVPEVELKQITPGAEVEVSKFWFNLKK